jgi:dTDP-4-amino-4,6-dideoxygalactose transaminase
MIRLIKPYIQFDEIEHDFREVFESGWFTKGPWVDRFRLALRDYTKSVSAFLCTSATTALSASLRALGVTAGDEVLVADFSFPATANVVEDLGARPVFVDVRPDTFTMDPAQLVQKIARRTKAAIFVDALGNPAGVTEVKQFCDEHGFPLIEDSACGIGSSEAGVKVGAIADLSCFSFHPRKLLTTGEGGAITCRTDDWDEFFRVKLNHGAIMEDERVDFVDFGYNYRLPDLQCIMGLRQLEKIESIVSERLGIRAEYDVRLKRAGYKVQHVPESVVHNVQSLVFKVPNAVSRDGLIAHLRAREIESTIGTYCLSGTTYYREKYDDVQPTSWDLYNNTITLPCYQGVDVELVCDAILEYSTRQVSDKR